MNIVVDESRVAEVVIKANQVRVLSNVLLNGYFDQDIKTSEDLRKIGGFYYDNARTLVEIMLSLIYDAETELNGVIDEAEVIGGTVNG